MRCLLRVHTTASRRETSIRNETSHRTYRQVLVGTRQGTCNAEIAGRGLVETRLSASPAQRQGALHATRLFRGMLHDCIPLFLPLSLCLDVFVLLYFNLFSIPLLSPTLCPCIRPSSGQLFLPASLRFLSHAHAALEGKKPTTASNNKTLFGRLMLDLTPWSLIT